MNELQPTTNPNHNNNPLIKFQADVLEGRTDDIRAFIERLAQEATNRHLLDLAKEKGFQTYWHPDLYGGHRIMLARDLARLCYKTDDVAGLRQLFQSRGHELLALTDASEENLLRLQLLEHFDLPRFTSRLRFATWAHVMIASADGKSKAARLIWNYIETTVKYAEADQESRRQTGQGVIENVTQQLGHGPLPIELAQRNIDAYRAIGEMFGTPLHLVLAEAVKQTKRELGVDLHQLLSGSPAMDNIPESAVMLEPTSLAAYFGFRKKGKAGGGDLNKALALLGWQTQTHEDGPWLPTERGFRLGQAARHTWVAENKIGYNYKWNKIKVEQALEEHNLLDRYR